MVVGSDPYLNEMSRRDWQQRARQLMPDADVVQLDAATTSRYAFDEAVSPSLLAESSIVMMENLQLADEDLTQAMVSYCKDVASADAPCVVICGHEGGVKGKRVLDQLAKAGAYKDPVPDLKTAEAKLNFVMAMFERLHRRVEPAAAQQLVAVLGERTGELAAMCRQLCFDFDDDPITLALVNQYLTGNPQVTGFAVADAALAGRTSEAIITMRQAIEQGIDPIALIGALAMKLRTLAKASAVKSGVISQAESKTNPYILRKSMALLSGWTSVGLGTCIQALADADEQCKTNGGDPIYALEQAIVLIGARGIRR